MHAALQRQVAAALPSDLPDHVGVAVSGGGDSVALLLLLKEVASRRRLRLSAVTVDHGLRAEAAAEARAVSEMAARLDVAHETLRWRGWDGVGNVQAAARAARYRLMADWAQAEGIGAIALGHTLDDQAETVVMRLARSAGVDGLSAMAPVHRRHGLRWLRPLLGARRDDLRAFLRAEGVAWQEDPSNENAAFDRIRVRRALALLAPLGVRPEALAQVAANMRDAREALEWQTGAAAASLASTLAGAVRIDREGFAALPGEIARRLAGAALRWITGSEHDPRGRSLGAALAAVAGEGSATLDGCRFLVRRRDLWIFREHAAVRSLRCPVGELWDGRWRLAGPHLPGDEVAALGTEGLAQCGAWRETGLPHALLVASPAVWRGGALCAAPLAGVSDGWTARLEKRESCFTEAGFAH